MTIDKSDDKNSEKIYKANEIIKSLKEASSDSHIASLSENIDILNLPQSLESYFEEIIKEKKLKDLKNYKIKKYLKGSYLKNNEKLAENDNNLEEFEKNDNISEDISLKFFNQQKESNNIFSEFLSEIFNDEAPIKITIPSTEELSLENKNFKKFQQNFENFKILSLYCDANLKKCQEILNSSKENPQISKKIQNYSEIKEELNKKINFLKEINAQQHKKTEIFNQMMEILQDRQKKAKISPDKLKFINQYINNHLIFSLPKRYKSAKYLVPKKKNNSSSLSIN